MKEQRRDKIRPLRRTKHPLCSLPSAVVVVYVIGGGGKWGGNQAIDDHHPLSTLAPWPACLPGFLGAVVGRLARHSRRRRPPLIRNYGWIRRWRCCTFQGLTRAQACRSSFFLLLLLLNTGNSVPYLSTQYTKGTDANHSWRLRILWTGGRPFFFFFWTSSTRTGLLAS